MSEARKLWVYETGDYEQAYTAGGWLTFSEAVEGVKAKYPAPYVVTWGESPNETDEFPELEGDFAGVPGWAYPHRASFRFSAIEFHDAERDSLAASLEAKDAELSELRARVEAAVAELREFVAQGGYEFEAKTAPEAFLQQELKDIISRVRAILSPPEGPT